jgi:hypothetical protein
MSQPGEEWMALRRGGGALIGALGMLIAASSAAAEVRIRHDMGGQIGPYLHRYAAMREAGHRVVIDGPCLSACTLAVAVIPRERICVTQNAVLGFHAAWMPGSDGRPVTSPGGTRLLMAVYPQRVRNWIRRRGGLNGKTIYLRGRELTALYRTCT